MESGTYSPGCVRDNTTLTNTRITTYTFTRILFTHNSLRMCLIYVVLFLTAELTAAWENSALKSDYNILNIFEETSPENGFIKLTRKGRDRWNLPDDVYESHKDETLVTPVREEDPIVLYYSESENKYKVIKTMGNNTTEAKQNSSQNASEADVHTEPEDLSMKINGTTTNEPYYTIPSADNQTNVSDNSSTVPYDQTTVPYNQTTISYNHTSAAVKKPESHSPPVTTRSTVNATEKNGSKGVTNEKKFTFELYKAMFEKRQTPTSTTPNETINLKYLLMLKPELVNLSKNFKLNASKKYF